MTGPGIVHPFGAWPFPCACGAVLFGLAASVFWIWALVDCATKEPPQEDTNKIVWILVIVFTHFLGALLYVLIRRPERLRLYGK